MLSRIINRYIRWEITKLKIVFGNFFLSEKVFGYNIISIHTKKENDCSIF